MSPNSGATTMLASTGPNRRWRREVRNAVQAPSSQTEIRIAITIRFRKYAVGICEACWPKGLSAPVPRTTRATTNKRMGAPNSARKYQRTPAFTLKYERRSARVPDRPSASRVTRKAVPVSPMPSRPQTMMCPVSRAESSIVHPQGPENP